MGRIPAICIAFLSLVVASAPLDHLTAQEPRSFNDLSAAERNEYDRVFNEWLASLDTAENVGRAVNDPTKSIADVQVDLAVPDSPAFSVLNVDAEKAVKPASARELALQLLEGLDDNGNLQSGLAIDLSPGILLGGSPSLRAYRDDYGPKLIARTQLSMAVVKGTDTDEDESIKASIGLRSTLWDRGDLRTSDDFENRCATIQPQQYQDGLDHIQMQAVEPRAGAYFKDSGEIDPELLKRDLDKAFEDGAGAKPAKFFGDFRKCTERVRKDLWNASSLSIGLAPIWFSEDGSFERLDGEGFAFWGSLAYGFEDFDNVPMLQNGSQLILHARYHSDEKVLDPGAGNNTFIEQDKLTLAAQLRISPGDLKPFFTTREKPIEGGTDWTLFADFAYIEEDRTGLKDEEVFRYSTGIEYKLDDGTYFKLSIGSEDGRERGGEETFLLSRLKVDFSSAGQGAKK